MHLAQRLRSLPAIAWLVLALVWAPLLGHWHQVAHAGLPGQGEHPSAFLADHTPVDCLLLDQLALGDAPPGAAAPALPAMAPAQAPAALQAQQPPARQALPFQARGPPAASLI